MAKSYNNRKSARKVRFSKFGGLWNKAVASLASGIVRGMGMALGFSGLAVILIFLLRYIPLTDIPLIGEIVDAIISNSAK